MSLFRSLLYRHFQIILKPPQSHLHGSSATARHTSLMFTKPVSNSALFDVEWAGSDGTNEEKKKPKKPLHVLFKEAVGLIEKLEYSDGENQIDTNELKGRLRKLEGAVKGLKERKSEKKEISSDLKKKPRNRDAFLKGKSKPTSLYALFSGKASSGSGNIENVEALTMEDPAVYKELSPDMMLFVTHLYKEGYFNNANFLPTNKFDVSCFENSYARDFIKFAAEKFGQNNQEIGKWLSASDLKKVALFGCPSLGKKTVFSAKRLRTFFGIQEQIVCSKCALSSSCKFVNESVWKGDYKNLDFAVVMRVITLYALESVPPQLVVPDEIKDCVRRMLKEIVSISQNTLT